MINNSLCKYQFAHSDLHEPYQCEHQSISSNKPFCVFHIQKPETNSLNVVQKPKAQAIENEFKVQFLELILKAELYQSEFIDLRGFQFPKIDFVFDKPFPKRADFSFAVFNSDIDFSGEFPNPNPKHKYDDSGSLLLQNGASFDYVLFKGEATFSGCQINAEISFDNSTFERKALFHGFFNTKLTTFNKTIFGDDVDFAFSGLGSIRFDETKFQKATDFTNLIVGTNCSFSSAVFSQPLELYQVHFGQSVFDDDNNENEQSIENSEFRDLGHTSFDNAIFNEKVLIEDIFVNNEISFESATFKKQTNIVFKRSDMFTVACDFRGITLPKDEDFVFEKVNLSKVKFHDTNLEKIIFRDVEWGAAKTRLQRFFRGNSHILWDEIRPFEGMNDFRDDSKTAENYRQLVLNYESKRDYETAEYFHIGEMEMLRKKVGDLHRYKDYEEYSKFSAFFIYKLKFHYLNSFWHHLRKYLNGYGLYWLSSRYGTSYAQAISVLLLLIFSFSLLFFLSGFKSNKENSFEGERIVEYNLFPDLNHVNTTLSHWLSDFITAISYTLSIVTFQKERFYEPLGWQSQFLLYLAVFVLTAQTALVLLAIRRVFRR